VTLPNWTFECGAQNKPWNATSLVLPPAVRSIQSTLGAFLKEWMLGMNVTPFDPTPLTSSAHRLT
jgi:hypothetical protein